MMCNKKRKFIIPPPKEEPTISLNPIYKEDYPIFCFKYLNDNASISKCKDHKIFFDFIIRLKKLSELGWSEIRKSNRHSFGFEMIPVQKIKPRLPECVTPDVKVLQVFRVNGNNLPFVGLQCDKIFRVFFIETKFGDIYDHN